MNQYAVIVNPISGRGAGQRDLPELERLLNQNGLKHTTILTQAPKHAIDLAKQAALDGYEMVVAVGGDGTANEVLNGLMQAKEQTHQTYTMGIIGVGRGNDFGFGANIPAGIQAGVNVLAENKQQLIDVGFVTGGDYPQGRYFGNGIGIGFDAVVGFEAVKLTWLSGFPSYIVAVLKTIFLYYRAPLVKLEYNEKSLELPTLMVSIMNGRRMGGGFMMAPLAKIDDGLLTICVVRQVSRSRIFSLVPHFMKGTQETQKEIQFLNTNELIVKALKGSLPAHADGETLCVAGDQLKIKLLPKQVKMICQHTE
jgi:diacylglycerol kinase (ATP)